LRRIAYLVSELPARNHNYLFGEILGLRDAGITVLIASVSRSTKQAKFEADEAERSYCIKDTPLRHVLRCMFLTAIGTPLGFIAGLGYAISLWNIRGVFYFVEAVLLGSWMQQNKLLHVHSHFAAKVALIACKVFPMMSASFTAHGYGEFYSPGRFKLPALIAGARFVRAISHVGRANLMLAAPQNKWDDIVYAPLGVNPEVFYPSGSQGHCPTIRITCVGRIAPEKGQRILILALAELVKGHSHVHLRFVGDGPDKQAMEDLCVHLGIANYVTFDGWTDSKEMVRVYEETDIFAMASLYEGIPVVLMEAMAMQLPCVAPRVGGIAELIHDEISGLLYNPAAQDELIGALRLLIESPDLRVAIGKAARNRVLQKYDIRTNAEMFAEILFAIQPSAVADHLTRRYVKQL
jgi:colanic acid/amylovoran biosynthesis glycosyltransferase